MNPLKALFKQTFIYGLATVLPKMLSFILVMLHTNTMMPAIYGDVTLVFAWLAIFNVLLTYGIETAFFRFWHKENNPNLVVSTALLSVLGTTLSFLIVALSFKNSFAQLIGISKNVAAYVIIILALDTLAVVPFAYLRAQKRPIRYTAIKVTNVVLNFGLNFFFLALLPLWVSKSPNSYWGNWYVPNFQVAYVFIANVLASALTLIWVSGLYFDIKLRFNISLWKKMMRYALPVMLAGIAFTINEVFDRVLLEKLLPPNVAKALIGQYSACYKLAVFMTLFGTAFRLGVEPFFFSEAKQKNAPKTYAQITKYFVLMGSFIFLVVIVFIHPLKKLLVRDASYYGALPIVPIVLLAAFCLGVYHNLSVWYKITDRTKYGAYISGIGAAITIVINVVFIPTYGYMASAWATLLAYSVMMVVSYLLGKKYYPIPYNLRKILFYSGLSFVFSFLSFYVFNHNLIIGALMLLVFLTLLIKLEGAALKNIFLKSEN